MAKHKRRPIDAAFVREFCRRMTARGGPAISNEAIDQWAAKHLDGKTRDERETAVCGPLLAFLGDQMRDATKRLWNGHAARNPSPN
jgi:hypothetical protein